MKSRLTCVLLATLLAVASSVAAAGFVASTDRTSYTGTVTVYDSLSDAQSGVNARSGPHTIPDRNTGSPYDTAYRDAGIYFIDGMAAVDADANIFLTAWHYTTSDNTNGKPKDDPDGDRLYSGWGNPNNTNTGFLQLYDADGSTDTSLAGYFSVDRTEFTLSATGQNAVYDDTDPSNDYARLWHAPNTGGTGALTKGEFIDYDLDVSFGFDSAAVWNAAGYYEQMSHPTSVTGTFSAMFENTNTVDTSLNGFYVIDYTFGLDSWAYGVGPDALNGDLTDSYFAGQAVPEPVSMIFFGTGLVGVAGLVTRKRMRR